MTFEEILNDNYIVIKIEKLLTYLTPKQQRECGYQFAMSVLHIYEKQYPDDMRIRNLLNAIRNNIDHDTPIDQNILIEAKNAWDAARAVAAHTAAVAADAASWVAVAAVDAASANEDASAVSIAWSAATAKAIGEAVGEAVGEAAGRWDAWDAARYTFERKKQIEIIKNVYYGEKNDI